MINSIVPAVRSFAIAAAPVAKIAIATSVVVVAHKTVLKGIEYGTFRFVTALGRRYLNGRPVVNHTPSWVARDLKRRGLSAKVIPFPGIKTSRKRGMA